MPGYITGRLIVEVFRNVPNNNFTGAAFLDQLYYSQPGAEKGFHSSAMRLPKSPALSRFIKSENGLVCTGSGVKMNGCLLQNKDFTGRQLCLFAGVFVCPIFEPQR